MTTNYKHTQTGYVIILSLLLLILIFGSIFVFRQKTNDNSFLCALWQSSWIILPLLVGLILFWNLTVKVDKEFLKFWFGPGLIRKRIPLEQIASCRAIKNHWIDGWGIRSCHSCWLYNVSGFEGVEIKLKSGKKLRLGTDEPEKLIEAILQAITPNE